jgi:hypothetical protein
MPMYIPYTEFSEDQFACLYLFDEKYAVNMDIRWTGSDRVLASY